jgi:hypothetical protein
MSRNRSSRGLFVLCLLWGCATPGPETPNVYQPPTSAQHDCSEIEYAWETGNGQAHEFYIGLGNFCTHISPLDTTIEMPLRARCVERDGEGRVIKAGGWVQGRWASLEEFEKACLTAAN